MEVYFWYPGRRKFFLSTFGDGDYHFAHKFSTLENNSSRLNVFIDGVKVYDELVLVDAPNFFDFSGPFNDFFIGANSDEESSFFKGLISEIKISDTYKYSDNFVPGSLENDENTVALWNFNSGTGNTLYDLSGNENHGEIFGEPTWTTDVLPIMDKQVLLLELHTLLSLI